MTLPGGNINPMSFKLISNPTLRHYIQLGPKLSDIGPFCLQIGAGVLAFSGSDAAQKYYDPSKGDGFKFTYILNVAKVEGDPSQSGAVRFYPVREGDTNGYREIAKRTFPEIQAVLLRGENVLIHCREGQVRSTTLFMFFLTETLCQPISTARSWVRTLSTSTNPTMSLFRYAASLPSLTEVD